MRRWFTHTLVLNSNEDLFSSFPFLRLDGSVSFPINQLSNILIGRDKQTDRRWMWVEVNYKSFVRMHAFFFFMLFKVKFSIFSICCLCLSKGTVKVNKLWRPAQFYYFVSILISTSWFKFWSVTIAAKSVILTSPMCYHLITHGRGRLKWKVRSAFGKSWKDFRTARYSLL